ncbi:MULTISPECIES: hypothetical protein [Halomonadaceae]|uniref:hypothetical protein n=1 Tax=Halomonadaceae TaxID=28256 RepID=UPI00159B28F4|nr:MULTISPECIES: hypothetical protein [Halomonas]QJQ94561.1 hypothetical protein HIO72_04205 [Halomonas sp. PA5]
MPTFKPRHSGMRRAAPHGATPRRQAPPPAAFDRWLNRAVDIAVILAMAVGSLAFMMHLR